MKFRDALDAFELVIRQKMSDEFAGAANNGLDEKIDRVVIQSKEAMIITLVEWRGNAETAGLLESLDKEIPTAKPINYLKPTEKCDKPQCLWKFDAPLPTS